MRSHSLVCGSAVAAVLVAAGSVAAGPVGLGAFGGGTVIESFEGLSAGPNIPAGTFVGSLQPGTSGPYTFASGVSFVDPVPNTARSGVFVFDYAIGGASTTGFGLAANGTINSATEVPDGTAYIARNSGSGFMTFEFASVVDRVGAFVTSAPGSLTIEALSAADVVLDSTSISAVDESLWGSNFLGIETAGIKKVRFSGRFVIMDQLRWELDNPIIPLPSGVAMGVVGIGLVGVRRRRG